MDEQKLRKPKRKIYEISETYKTSETSEPLEPSEISEQSEISEPSEISDTSEISEPSEPSNKLNKGSGGGGSNTNLYGKEFEELTNNEYMLVKYGFEKKIISKGKYAYYLTKTFEDKEIIFVLQYGLNIYMKKFYDISLFRCPDEAYIIKYNDGRIVIKILEKKEQNVEGSCDIKLWCGPSIKREYELVLGDNFKVVYAFTLNNYFKTKINSGVLKYNILKKILNENDINILFGEDYKYFDKIYEWIKS